MNQFITFSVSGDILYLFTLIVLQTILTMASRIKVAFHFLLVAPFLNIFLGTNCETTFIGYSNNY